MKILDMGSTGPQVGIVACLHGNETTGIKVLTELKSLAPEGLRLRLIVAHETAVAQNTRFITQDLNRCFPGDRAGNKEQQLAAMLLEQLQDCAYVIDLHTTTARTKAFSIMTLDTPAHRWLAQSYPLPIHTIIGDTVASGKAMIDHVTCGISVEYENTSPAGIITHDVLSTLAAIRSGRCASVRHHTWFEVYGVMEKHVAQQHAVSLENFAPVTIAGERFYPVLAGEAAYRFACMKARKTEDATLF
ncbi:MAG: hypothetical protein ACOCWQ_04365 [Nanoarchaeota archaeon]